MAFLSTWAEFIIQQGRENDMAFLRDIRPFPVVVLRPRAFGVEYLWFLPAQEEIRASSKEIP